MRRVIISDYQDLGNACGIVELNGRYPGVKTSIGRLRFCTRDSAYPWDNDPCVVSIIPGQCNYSYVKTILFRVNDWIAFSDALGCNSIRDIGFYYSGSLDFSGVELLAGMHSLPMECYRQSEGIQGTTGFCEIDEVCDLSEFDENHPYMLSECMHDSEFYTNIMMLQVKISNDVKPGDLLFPRYKVVGVVD